METVFVAMCFFDANHHIPTGRLFTQPPVCRDRIYTYRIQAGSAPSVAFNSKYVVKCIPKHRERRKNERLAAEQTRGGDPSRHLYHSLVTTKRTMIDPSRASFMSRSKASRDECSVDRSYSSQSFYSNDDGSYASRSFSWSNSISTRNEQNHDQSHSSGSVSHYHSITDSERRYHQPAGH